MANFIGADAGKSKWQQQQPKLDPVSRPDVPLMSPDTKSKAPWIVCHACNVAHNGDGEKCNQISKKVRAPTSAR